MAIVAWICALFGGVLALAMSAGSAAGVVRRMDLPSALTVTGSSAIPHFGHDPGPICRTSGCIGQVYSALSGTIDRAVDGVRNRSGSARNRSRQLFAQK